jgi:hypothetical protein
VRQTGFTYRFLTALMLIIACVAAPATAQVIGTVSSPDSDKATATYTFPDSATIDSIYRTLTPETYTLSPENSRVAMKRNGGAPIKEITVHRPDPEKATWLALIIPGGGQIYNRKYWKLPIVYGGFVGCLYAYNWNGQMYKDYRQAYLDIMDSDPNTDSYKDFFRPGYDYEANKEYLTNVFKKRKDRYRRWRDLSIFAFIGVYAVSVIDAYVDAQLSSFDIAEDINLTIEPQRIRGNGEFMQQDYYGLNFNISF